MSWEGYAQILCKNGHYHDINADEDVNGEHRWKCPFCGEVGVWWNIVNTTNGSYYDDGTRVDGYVELEIKDKPTICKCSSCGNEHFSKIVTYKIPNGVGKRI